MTTPSAPPARLRPTRRKEVRAAVAGAAGTALEWYDYGLFGAASALYLAPLFFSGTDELSGQLAAFATFAVGFIARPFGGIVLGHIGDRVGRKAILVFTILLIGVATFLIGLLPTNAQIGVWAPVLLVLLRLIQGFGAGAELAGALIYVNESTGKDRRGFLTSFAGASSVVGLLLGLTFFAILNGTLGEEAMLEYGWRIPFLASAVLVVITLLLRARIEDSAEFEAARALREQAATAPRAPLFEILANRKLAILGAFLALITLNFGGYVIFTFSLSYLANTLDVSAQVTLVTSIFGGLFAVAACIGFGRLADKVGPVPLLVAGAIGTALFAFPFFLLLNTREPVLIVLAVAVGYSLSWGIATAAQGLFLPSLFDTRYRFSGVALSRELNSALIGGPASAVAVALVALAGGAPWLVAGAMVLGSVLTLAGVKIGASQAEATHEIDRPVEASSAPANSPND